MAKIYGNPITFGGGTGGQNADLPPLLDNFKASVPIEGIPVKDMPVGTKIKVPVNADYQSFLGENIVWLVADQNHEGYPANSSTLLSEKIIALLCYDAAEPENPIVEMKSGGNNNYIQSNANQWLNSNKSAGQWYEPQHSYDTPPTAENLEDGANEYFSKAGFLSMLNSSFANLLLNTDLTVLSVPSGSETSNFTAKMFYPSITEVGLTNENGVAEGEKLALFNDTSYLKAKCSQFAINNSTMSNNPTVDEYWYWSLRTPVYASRDSARDVNDRGTMAQCTCYRPITGVRPFCNIPSSTQISDNPDADGYYTLQLKETSIKRAIPWSKTKDFYARQFTYNSEKQYQTMLEGALASVIVEGAPAQVTDLVVTGSGGTATLTWVNPVDDPVYAETVVVQKVGSTPSDITDGTEIYRGTDQTCTATGLEQSTDYYFAVYTVSGLGVYKQPVVSDVYSYDFPAEPTDYLDCAEISETTEYEIPEDGWFRIDAIAKSGNGGYTVEQTGNLVVTPGGGGTGGYSRSEIAANKGDIISIEIQNGSITIKSDIIESLNISVSRGGDGIAATSPSEDSYGGSGGKASGGNKINEKGLTGSTEKEEEYSQEKHIMEVQGRLKISKSIPVKYTVWQEDVVEVLKGQAM